ncbi:MAG: ABC transporter permease, partial [Candidatus Aminicenantes bacterium]|nr:ABC transporter permease [Candidatus Aminicenantes bacterium]
AIKNRKDMTVDEKIDKERVNDLIREGKIDFILVFEEEFDKKIAKNRKGQVQLYFKASAENNIAKRRIIKLLNDFKENLLEVRLKALNLEKSFIEALEINEIDLASAKEKIGEAIGGLLPYFFVIFCFLGAMYPAIDLAAGEKERATIETLLTSPASRIQIVMGKFFVVTFAGLGSAVIAMVGLFFSVRQLKEIPTFIMDEILRIIEFKSIVLLFSLLIPLCVFFAAILLSFSIFANSFKEAQSTMTPLNFLVIIPAFLGLLPGIKLNATTALVPILNVSLATKEIISGTIKTGLLVEVYLSLFVLAALSLYFCTFWFKREAVIFRGT